MQDEREVEISLKHMFFYFLRRWKQLLLAAVIGLLLIGGANLALNMRAESAKTASDEEVKKEIPKELYEEQKKLNTQLYNLEANRREEEKQQRILDQTEEYIQNSVLMRLDPYSKLTEERRYAVSMDGSDSYEYFRDPADPVVSAYTQGLINAIDFSTVSKKYSIDPAYLKELISCWNDTNSNTVTLGSTGESSEMALAVIDAAEEALFVRQEEIAAKYGKHEIQKVFDSETTVIDNDLLGKQRNNLDSLAAAQNALTRARNAIYDAESQIPELQENVEKAGTKPAKSPLRASLKSAVLGFLLGGCAMGGWYLLRYLFPPRLHTAEEMKDYWDIPVLGVFDKKSDARAFKAIDEWLLKLSGEVTGQADNAVVSNMAVTLGNLLPDGVRLAVTGDVSEAQLTGVSEALSCALKEKNIILTNAPNMRTSAKERRMFAESDAALLVVERGTSTYQNMTNLIDLISMFGKKIVGCIVY